LLVALVPALPLVALGACQSAPAAHLGLVMKAPAGLLDQATSVELSVFDVGSSKCESDGTVKNAPSGGVSTFDLDDKDCPKGTSWCTTIQLDKDNSTKMFSVVAKNASGNLGQGCATAAIDQDPLSVSIQIKRFVAPACCNDGAVQVGEQCDNGVQADPACDGSPAKKCGGIAEDDVCDCSCQAKEILLSIDDTAPPYVRNGSPGSKSALALAFTPGNGNLDRALRAVYVSTYTDAKGGADVLERYLQPDLTPFTDPVPLASQLMLPVACQAVQDATVNGYPNHQQAPRIAAIGNTTAIVYMSDENQGGNYDIFLVPQTGDGCADQPSCSGDGSCVTHACVTGICATSQQISATETVPGSRDPDVAGGPPDAGLVVWTLGNDVFARVWKTDGTLVPDVSPILIAQNASEAKVAGNANGWQVVYQGSGSGDADGVFMKSVTLDAQGQAVVGQEVKVNAVTQGLQDQPAIAMLEDGRTIVVWHSGGDVYFQRFAADGTPNATDQNAPLNTVLDGDQQHPAVAASIGAGEFFVVAWETIDTSNVSARFVGGSTDFGYNSVDGQNDEFVATHPAITGQRHRPAVAVGGGGYVAIGWDDDSTDHAGVFVRRFPLPFGL
ncbi:MAG TPA: hypothetical protein VHB21_15880, partial [Minicystis sp.]|nr:hypothetical protein [Minicystis sp.]